MLLTLKFTWGRTVFSSLRLILGKKKKEKKPKIAKTLWFCYI